MEARIPKGHSLRRLRPVIDRGLACLELQLSAMYASEAMPSSALEKLIRALRRLLSVATVLASSAGLSSLRRSLGWPRPQLLRQPTRPI